ncbi:AMP-binding protein [Aquipuribacter hungaricus]|uniref:AMP-binding protein n=1 Tax=Aquipuribacter hungaricus TaxID=545624 RepID=A0ABV7WCP8_9MICO
MTLPTPVPPLDVPDDLLTPYVLGRAAALGDRPALVDAASGRALTYAALDAGVRALAGGLVARGHAPGDAVALMSPNLPEYAVVFHGVAMAGGVVCTVNPTYTAHEVHEQLVDSGARLLVTVPAFLTTATEAAAGTAVEQVVVLGEVPEGSDAVPLQQLLGDRLAEQVPVGQDAVVALPYSSGTQGLPKGVMLTHRNLVANVAQTQDILGAGDGEVFMGVLPFFHIYGMNVVMNVGLVTGSTIVTMPRFDLAAFLQAHERYRVTRSFVAPPIVVALAKHPAVEGVDLSSLVQVVSGAAPLSAELAAEASARLGVEVVQGYGMTEMSPVSHFTRPGGYRAGSVGVAVAGTEHRVVDPATGEDLGVDADGELWVRGPQVMKGYLGNDEATAATLDPDGWLRTGDIGHVDADGYLYVVDRLKELIKVKGFQVAPAELEALLLTHPDVTDAAVVGVQDEQAGELPVGHVVLRAGAGSDADAVRAWVAERTATYKHLHRLLVVDAIPKSASGKILRRVLRQELAG